MTPPKSGRLRGFIQVLSSQWLHPIRVKWMISLDSCRVNDSTQVESSQWLYLSQVNDPPKLSQVYINGFIRVESITPPYKSSQFETMISLESSRVESMAPLRSPSQCFQSSQQLSLALCEGNWSSPNNISCYCRKPLDPAYNLLKSKTNFLLLQIDNYVFIQYRLIYGRPGCIHITVLLGAVFQLRFFTRTQQRCLYIVFLFLKDAIAHQEFIYR